MAKHTPSSAGRSGLRQRLFARAYARCESVEEPAEVERYKREIFARLHGDVIEIGPGLGSNFVYLPNGVRWTGIEPNLFMHAPLRESLAKAGAQGEIHTGTAEHIDMPDASADGLISTFVLCSVTSLDGALAEILRVLRPGGQFVFLEHVIAPERTMLRFVQRLIKPVWKLAADGCHPDRDIEAAIRRAGFARVEVQSFHVPEFIVSPRIAGIATK